jgi:hypothetical protein
MVHIEFDVEKNVDVECIFENMRNEGSITITKTTQKAEGGVPTYFNFSVDGVDPFDAVLTAGGDTIADTEGPVTVRTETYTIWETIPENWVHVDVDCNVPFTELDPDSPDMVHIEFDVEKNVDVECEFINEPRGMIVWEKIDAFTDELLGGAIFSVDPNPFGGVDPLEVTDCLAAECTNDQGDQNPEPGIFKLTVPPGTYKIKEISPPTGPPSYQLTEHHREVTVIFTETQIVEEDFINAPNGCKCKKVNSLVLIYNGEEDAEIVITDHKKGHTPEGNILFSGTVSQGEEMLVLPFPDVKTPKLNPRILITVDGVEEEIHTSCSQPIFVGLTTHDGDIEITELDLTFPEECTGICQDVVLDFDDLPHGTPLRDADGINDGTIDSIQEYLAQFGISIDDGTLDGTNNIVVNSGGAAPDKDAANVFTIYDAHYDADGPGGLAPDHIDNDGLDNDDEYPFTGPGGAESDVEGMIVFQRSDFPTPPASNTNDYPPGGVIPFVFKHKRILEEVTVVDDLDPGTITLYSNPDGGAGNILGTVEIINQDNDTTKLINNDDIGGIKRMEVAYESSGAVTEYVLSCGGKSMHTHAHDDD